MTTISNSATVAPQCAEPGSPDASQTPNDPRRIELVVKSIHVDQEMAEVARNLARAEALERELTDMTRTYKEARATGTPAATLRAYESRLELLRMEALRLQPNVPNPEKIAELKLQLGTLESRLNDGGLSPGERRDIESDRFWVDVALEHELFKTEGGGSEHDFSARLFHKWALEAGTLRSRLNDGGLTPKDQEATRERLARLDDFLQRGEKYFKGKQSVI